MLLPRSCQKSGNNQFASVRSLLSRALSGGSPGQPPARRRQIFVRRALGILEGGHAAACAPGPPAPRPGGPLLFTNTKQGTFAGFRTSSLPAVRIFWDADNIAYTKQAFNALMARLGSIQVCGRTVWLVTEPHAGKFHALTKQQCYSSLHGCHSCLQVLALEVFAGGTTAIQLCTGPGTDRPAGNPRRPL